MTLESARDASAKTFNRRISGLDWGRVREDLDRQGFAVVDNLLDAKECVGLAGLYSDDTHFRSHIVMARHGYGQGEYKYFSYPLPEVIERLRIDIRYPADHAGFLNRCHAAGQIRPTPLLLKYQTGDYNCLHQDLYGEHVFPLQVAILLSAPGSDFTGGEFILTEQRPRMQSRAAVVPLDQGDAVVFAVRHRPVQGNKSTYRVNIRHGVSMVRSGNRYTSGVIFHDAN